MDDSCSSSGIKPKGRSLKMYIVSNCMHFQDSLKALK